MIQLIDAEAARKRLGLSSVQSIYRLARENLIPSVRLGRRVRFDLVALEEFVATGGRTCPDGEQRESGAHLGAS